MLFLVNMIFHFIDFYKMLVLYKKLGKFMESQDYIVRKWLMLELAGYQVTRCFSKNLIQNIIRLHFSVLYFQLSLSVRLTIERFLLSELLNFPSVLMTILPLQIHASDFHDIAELDFWRRADVIFSDYSLLYPILYYL